MLAPPWILDEHAMARAIDRIGAIDPVACRESVRSRYDRAVTAAGYEAVYRRAIGPGVAIPDLTAHTSGRFRRAAGATATVTTHGE